MAHRPNPWEMAGSLMAILDDDYVSPLIYIRICEIVNEMGLDWKTELASLRLEVENGGLWCFRNLQHGHLVYRGVDVNYLGRDEYEILSRALETIKEAPSHTFDGLNRFISAVVRAAHGLGLPALHRNTTRALVTTVVGELNSTRRALDTIIESYDRIHNSGGGYIQRCQDVHRQVLNIVFAVFGVPAFDANDEDVWAKMAHCAAVSEYFKEINCENRPWADDVHKMMTSIACVLHIKVPGFTHVRRLQDQMEPRRFKDLVKPLSDVLDRQISAFKRANVRTAKKQHFMQEMNPRCVAIQVIMDSHWSRMMRRQPCVHGQHCPAYHNWGQGHS